MTERRINKEARSCPLPESPRPMFAQDGSQQREVLLARVRAVMTEDESGVQVSDPKLHPKQASLPLMSCIRSLEVVGTLSSSGSWNSSIRHACSDAHGNPASKNSLSKSGILTHTIQVNTHPEDIHSSLLRSSCCHAIRHRIDITWPKADEMTWLSWAEIGPSKWPQNRVWRGRGSTTIFAQCPEERVWHDCVRPFPSFPVARNRRISKTVAAFGNGGESCHRRNARSSHT
jgi:hypothetical protein